METVYVNGKFTAQTTTGVQRVAHCMLLALDRRLASDARVDGRRWVLLCPPDSRPPALLRIETRIVGSRLAGLQWWEQWCLPLASRDGLLLSLAGTAPAVAARQLCTLHDAAIFDRPQAYAWLFLTWYRWLFRRLAKNAIGIDTVSEFSKGRLVERLGISPCRIKVIHSGGDHLLGTRAASSCLAEHGLTGRRFLLAVGSNSANKNLAAVIEAFSMLADDELCLVVAGSTRSAVFADAPGGAPDARIIRLGHVQDAELKALYEAAVALVFVSLYEGFGLPPLEAMSCGCPVLVSTAGALPEVCGNGAAYADAASPADIARGLRELLGDAALRVQLVAQGHRRVAALTWDRAAAMLQTHVESLALGGAARAA